MLTRIIDLSRDVQHLFQVLYQPIASLTTEKPQIYLPAFLDAERSLRRDWVRSVLLHELPTMSFLLLVAAKHLQTRDRDVFNFEIAFDEVAQFGRRSRRNREGAGTGGLGLKEMDTAATASPRSQRAFGAGDSTSDASDWQDRHRAMRVSNSQWSGGKILRVSSQVCHGANFFCPAASRYPRHLSSSYPSNSSSRTRSFLHYLSGRQTAVGGAETTETVRLSLQRASSSGLRVEQLRWEQRWQQGRQSARSTSEFGPSLILPLLSKWHAREGRRDLCRRISCSGLFGQDEDLLRCQVTSRRW